MQHQTDLLIVGAGPFGLAMAAQASHQGIDHLVVGRPMSFWREHMPAGMHLRSACDWHLDPLDEATIDAYLATRQLTPTDVEPLSLAFYLDYAEWFQQQKRIRPVARYVQRLDAADDRMHRFRATMDDGSSIVARSIVMAVGFRHFRHIPPALIKRLPAGRYAHTCDMVDLAPLKGRRCLIIGGRQSAYEWTALLNDIGATAVHVSHRHDCPAFAAADWSWVNPLVDAMVDDPAWFRRLSAEAQQQVSRRLWAEGRLKVEPWLEERVMRPTTHRWPGTEVVACTERADGSLRVELDNGGPIDVDQIILATGYKVDIARVPCLADGNLLPGIAIRDGFPVLDDHFQSSVPGLYITSMAAGQDFGPFFGFTISVRTSARVIGRALMQG